MDRVVLLIPKDRSLNSTSVGTDFPLLSINEKKYKHLKCIPFRNDTTNFLIKMYGTKASYSSEIMHYVMLLGQTK